MFADDANAGGVNLGNLKLWEKEIQNKGRFVFENNLPEEKSFATVAFNISIHPMNYQNLTDDAFLRLYIFVANHTLED